MGQRKQDILEFAVEFAMSRSKTLAEQRAYEISARPDCKWKLASICPAIVQGPPAGYSYQSSFYCTASTQHLSLMQIREISRLPRDLCYACIQW